MQSISSRVNTKACFIAGAGHSGSTLLGFILGSHTDAFYCGEAAKTRYLGDDRKQLVKRVCKLCGTQCPVWENFVVNEVEDLYEQVAIRVNKSLIIDSSKNVDWLKHQLSALERTSVRPYLIFLQRDGRAVINSRIRKYPHKAAADLIESWIMQIERTNSFFNAFPYQKLKLHYEELATNSVSVIERLCNLLGIEYQPEMLNYNQHEHHVLGGNSGTQFLVAQAQRGQLVTPFVTLSEQNRGYYESQDENIAIDLRWKHELDPAIVCLFEEMAGTVNQELKWNL